MARGILAGMLTGAIVGGAGLGFVSLMTGPPAPAANDVAAMEAEIPVSADALVVDPVVVEEIAIEASAEAQTEEVEVAQSVATAVEADMEAVVPPVDVAVQVTTERPYTAVTEAVEELDDTILPGQDSDAVLSVPEGIRGIESPTPPEVELADATVEIAQEAPVQVAVAEGSVEEETAEEENITPEVLDEDGEEEIVAPEETERTGVFGQKVGIGFGAPAGRLTDRTVVSRLPTIGASIGSDIAQNDAGAVAQDGGAEFLPHALTDNAAVFEIPVGKAMIAVILLDDGSAESASLRNKAGNLPFPVSIAVNAANPRAGEDAAHVRANGQEVLVQLALPEGARPSDVETGFLSVKSMVPDAVAVLDDIDRTIGSDRTVAIQLSEALSESGHGLVLYGQGLNTAGQLASRQGVPNARVFRVLDDEGQNASTIRRMLERAEFKAQQDGTVVLVGQLRNETLRALQEWALDGRGNNTALTPVSAVLQQR